MTTFDDLSLANWKERVQDGAPAAEAVMECPDCLAELPVTDLVCVCGRSLE